MSEMVERVAKAIYEARTGIGSVPWSYIGAEHEGAYLTQARAVLEAMRLPTSDMIERARKAPQGYGDRYTAMIDAALQEKEAGE